MSIYNSLIRCKMQMWALQQQVICTPHTHTQPEPQYTHIYHEVPELTDLAKHSSSFLPLFKSKMPKTIAKKTCRPPQGMVLAFWWLRIKKVPKHFSQLLWDKRALRIRSINHSAPNKKRMSIPVSNIEI